MMNGQATGERLRITGKVQGVGFRPWIWQLAQQLTLCGDVCNDGAGVEVRLTGSADELITHLRAQCPPLARIDTISRQPFYWSKMPDNFSIRASGGGAVSTQIVPDAATCPACLAELNDPADRRYAYPLLNCTHCGPRFTIINALPYDRPLTVMAAFPLCADCEREYRDAGNRRFHAQPVACPACGPQLSWQHASGQIAQRDEALQAAVAALLNGDIVAIKAIGGFHLACDASNPEAISKLRQRKRRPAKPLAVMIPDARGLAADIAGLLDSPAAPIVLVEKQALAQAQHSLILQQQLLAPGLTELGVMLPGNPLAHLIMQAVKRPLVMTSGNAAGQAPAISNDQALSQLAGIADGWLLHNRDIVQRLDDSLLRPGADGQHNVMFRRARGYVPDTLPLPPGLQNIPPLLATGADLKNTFCLARGDSALLSQHFGDLTQPGIAQQWQQTLQKMCAIWQFQPQWVVNDAHPAYLAGQWGRQLDLPVCRVQHHHAHAAACLAEHQWPLDGGAVIALVLDGIGYAGEQSSSVKPPSPAYQYPDHQWWGGECLLVDYWHYRHLGGLPAVALPGGDLAARQPWRNLLAHCQAFVPDWQSYAASVAGIEMVCQQNWQVLIRAIAAGVNSPRASSCGRLFDAAAAALGLVPLQQSYQGQAACWLEALASQCDKRQHPITLALDKGQLDLATFWQQWLSWQATPAQRAFAFHDALAAGLAALVRYHARQQAIDTIVCSGGVLHNRLLRQRLEEQLADFTLLFPRHLPAGDGAISFGQTVIAAARLSTNGLSPFFLSNSSLNHGDYNVNKHDA